MYKLHDIKKCQLTEWQYSASRQSWCKYDLSDLVYRHYPFVEILDEEFYDYGKVSFNWASISELYFCNFKNLSNDTDFLKIYVDKFLDKITKLLPFI